MADAATGSGAHEVEQTIQQLPHVRGPRPPTGLGGRDERRQQAELVVRQCLAGAKVSNQRAISRRPHGGLHAGNRLQRRPRGQDQPVKPAPSPLCKGPKTEDADRKVVDRVAQVAAARGIPRAQVALAWLLAKPVITAPIVGATKLQHLDDALASVRVKLSEEEIALLEEPYIPHAVVGFD